jgi:hypothetical protein
MRALEGLAELLLPIFRLLKLILVAPLEFWLLVLAVVGAFVLWRLWKGRQERRRAERLNPAPP